MTYLKSHNEDPAPDMTLKKPHSTLYKKTRILKTGSRSGCSDRIRNVWGVWGEDGGIYTPPQSNQLWPYMSRRLGIRESDADPDPYSQSRGSGKKPDPGFT